MLKFNDITLERADCIEIKMEIIRCNYRIRTPISMTLERESYVNSLHGEFFRLGKPMGSKCGDDSAWIILDAVTEIDIQ